MTDRSAKQGTLQQMGGKGNTKHGGKMLSAKESAANVNGGKKPKGY
jgi:hypothetical protein